MNFFTSGLLDINLPCNLCIMQALLAKFGNCICIDVVLHRMDRLQQEATGSHGR